MIDRLRSSNFYGNIASQVLKMPWTTFKTRSIAAGSLRDSHLRNE